VHLINTIETEPFKLGNKVLIQWSFRLVTKVGEKNKVLVQEKIPCRMKIQDKKKPYFQFLTYYITKAESDSVAIIFVEKMLLM